MKKQIVDVVDVIAKRVSGTVLQKTKGVPMTAVFDGLSQLNQTRIDYEIVREQEKTKREAIASQRDVSIETIRAQRDLMQSAINQTFGERKKILEAQIHAMDHALNSGSTEVLNKALDGMVSVIKESPFKNMAQIRKELEDDDFVLRLE